MHLHGDPFKDERHGQAEHHGKQQSGQDAEDAAEVAVRDRAPRQGSRTRIEQPGAHQAPDEGVPRTRRQGEPPGDQVPGRRPGQRGADDRDAMLRRDIDEPRDGGGNRTTQQQWADQAAGERSATAVPGRAARVATSVAVEAAALWNPLLSANTMARPNASESAGSSAPSQTTL